MKYFLVLSRRRSEENIFFNYCNSSMNSLSRDNSSWSRIIIQWKFQTKIHLRNDLSTQVHIYVVHLISFQTFFVWEFKFVIDSWEFSILLLYFLWDDWPIFMISGLNEQLQQQLENTLLKPDYHSWWISKMQSGREDTLEERYAIKLCFKLGKNDAIETYGMFQTAFGASCMNRASVIEWHKRFKEGRESMRDDERCGRSKLNTPVFIGQRVRVRVTMSRF